MRRSVDQRSQLRVFPDVPIGSDSSMAVVGDADIGHQPVSNAEAQGSEGEPGRRDLRVSDAEREHVVDLLRKAIGRGMLDLDEFTQRTDIALAAVTRGELNAVLADLPGFVHAENIAAPRERVELKNTMSATKRSGEWLVPAEMVVRNRLGSTELDFTEARIEHDEVRIELDVAAGSVEILVPDGASVSSEDVEVFAGALTDKSGHGGEPGSPRFVLVGEVRAGSVEIRRPKYWRRGRLVVRWPLKLRWNHAS
jgi:hypothetical protein